jgi:hypothetical protein
MQPRTDLHGTTWGAARGVGDSALKQILRLKKMSPVEGGDEDFSPDVISPIHRSARVEALQVADQMSLCFANEKKAGK